MVVCICDPNSPVARWEVETENSSEALGPATPEYAVRWGHRWKVTTNARGFPLTSARMPGTRVPALMPTNMPTDLSCWEG